FKPNCPLTEDSKYYISKPNLNDQIHCLVSVIPADKIGIMDGEVIKKLKTIQDQASKLGIPQMLFMKKVDKACIQTKKDKDHDLPKQEDQGKTLKQWRTIPKKPDEMVKFLEDFKVCTQEVTELRFLLHGPVGAGKSSTFNIIKNVFEGRIPQKLFMTKVDKACIRTKKDLTMIYQSKKIKEKMTECSDLLGIPINCIFPVKNYHEETEMNEMINSLMLNALIHTVHSANDYVKRYSDFDISKSMYKHIE
ncbi:hypothetical protein P4O66_008229, partial [Electrophorus voltai]